MVLIRVVRILTRAHCFVLVLYSRGFAGWRFQKYPKVPSDYLTVCHGKSPCFIGKPSRNGPFPIANRVQSPCFSSVSHHSHRSKWIPIGAINGTAGSSAVAAASWISWLTSYHHNTIIYIHIYIYIIYYIYRERETAPRQAFLVK